MPDSSPAVTVARSPLNGGHAARVSVDIPQPGYLNIIGLAEMQALTGHFEDLASDPGLRVVVLTGAGGKAFIGGANIHEMAALEPETAGRFITALHDVCHAIRHLPVPVIARIQGYCLGGGLEVAAACDLRVASEDAHFGMPEVKVGIPSVIEAALLPRLVGIGKARELVMTGAMIDAEEALKCGLIEKLVQASDLDAAVDGWLAHIAECGPKALAAQKALCRVWEERPLTEGIETGIAEFIRAFETGEPAQMMGDFLGGKAKR